MITAAQRHIPGFFGNQGHSIPDWAKKEPSKKLFTILPLNSLSSQMKFTDLTLSLWNAHMENFGMNASVVILNKM